MASAATRLASAFRRRPLAARGTASKTTACSRSVGARRCRRARNSALTFSGAGSGGLGMAEAFGSGQLLEGLVLEGLGRLDEAVAPAVVGAEGLIARVPGGFLQRLDYI